MPISSRSTCLLVLPPSSECAFSRSIERRCLSAGPANAIAFTVPLTGVGNSYSFVPATFRTGDAPPAGRNEMVLAIDSPATGGVTLTQVHGRFFHVDFGTPANSSFGAGTDHTPNAEITVNGFDDAFTNTTSDLVPQQGTTQKVDTFGDKIMTPGGVSESRRCGIACGLGQTFVLNHPNGTERGSLVSVRRNGREFSSNGRCSSRPGTTATTVYSAGCRASPWINAGNTAIGYSTSSATQEPSTFAMLVRLASGSSE